MSGDGVELTGEVAVWAERINVLRLQWRRDGLWPIVPAEVLGFLIVGPDDLGDVAEFQGCAVWRVEHWPGDPVLVVPAGYAVADAYRVARDIERGGVAGGKIRAFGPPGWEHVSVPLLGGRHGDRVDVVPVTGMTMPMIGVELT